jgi:hypothetical protein
MPVAARTWSSFRRRSARNPRGVMEVSVIRGDNLWRLQLFGVSDTQRRPVSAMFQDLIVEP